MHRRNFISSSGILLPALLGLPAVLFAEPDVMPLKALIVQGLSHADHRHSTALKAALKHEMQELSCSQVKHISFSGGAFRVTLTGSRVIRTSKLVFNTPYKIDPNQNRITILASTGNITIDYDVEETRPAFWALTREGMTPKKLLQFIGRDKPAFVCFS